MPLLLGLDQPHPYPGRLIAFEGLGSAGKSTQSRLLERWLAAKGRRVFHSEWESSDLVRAAMTRGREEQLFTPTTMSLLVATDFADRYERRILPMLKAGFTVICDRYAFWALAADTVRGCDPEWLLRLYKFAARPDITFYLDLPLPAALGRYDDRRRDLDYFEAGMDLGLSGDMIESFRIFQGRVHDEYLKLIGRYAMRVVDASVPISDQQAEIRRAAAESLGLDGANGSAS